MEKLSLATTEEKKTVADTRDKKTPKSHKLTWLWWLLGIVAAIILVVIVAGLVIANYSKKAVQAFQIQATETMLLAQEALDLFKAQDLPATKEKIAQTQASFEKTQSLYKGLESPLTIFRYKQYYQDGLSLMAAGQEGLALGNQVIDIMEPAAEMLGFGQDHDAEGGTTEDRVKKLLDTLEIIGPQLDVVIADLEDIAAHVETINADNYPATLGDLRGAKMLLKRMGKPELIDFPLHDTIVQAQLALDDGITLVKEYRPIIDKIPEMAGANGQRMKYLVLFQNNNELRPTGGFLTAYAVIYVEDGKVVPEKSDDIYELDKKFKERIPIPEELGRYLTTEKYWNLRDMNIDPDFKRSMDMFLEHYLEVPGEPDDINGIIAIDTIVLTDLIDILGPIQVEGYGEFSTEPDSKYGAPQIVVALSEIITRPTPYIREDRKGILGPMMKAMLEKVYSAGKEQFPALFAALISSINGRHLQAYFLDPQLQESAELINMAGRMLPPTDGSDFLAIVDANLGGAKSNLFIDYDVQQTVLPPENNQLTKRVVINYRNSRPGDNCNLEAGLLCLNSTNNDWHRVYLPLGSQLVSAKGFRGEPTVYDENGFTVIDGFFALNPNSTAKIDLEYTVPYTNPTTYQLKIWQQGGLRSVTHLLDVNDNQEEIIADQDIVYQTNF